METLPIPPHATVDEITCQADRAHAQAHKRGECIVYPNQKKAADRAVRYLIGKNVPLVNLIAQPGVGKTGTFLEVAIQATTHKDDHCRIRTSDLFICTGMSDNDWSKQTSQRMLPAFRDRVFHRNTLLNEAKRYYDKGNTPKLIIIDESHIATKPGMTVHTFINKIAKLPDDTPITPQRLLDANIRILAVSATPGAVLREPADTWDKAHHRIVSIQPADTYHGVEHMLKSKRLFKTGSIDDDKYLTQIASIMANSFGEKRYHIFRQSVSTGDLYEKFTRLIQHHTHLREFQVIRHDSEDRVAHMDTILRTQPDKHTIIVIKGFWRASKRLCQDWVGVTYDPPVVKVNVSAVIQGLVGRFCDNSKPRWLGVDTIRDPIHLVPTGAVSTYLEWVHSGYKTDDGGIRKSFMTA